LPSAAVPHVGIDPRRPAAIAVRKTKNETTGTGISSSSCRPPLFPRLYNRAAATLRYKIRMAKTEREYRQDIVEVGKLVYQKGWVASNDGNISIRLDAERILATPTGVCKGMMQPDDLIILDHQGQKIEGRLQATSEILMHLTIYKLRPDVQAVVHAHPPVATGFATCGRPLSQALLPEVILALGCVPLAAYGLPGTPALTEPMLPLIPKYDAILMANHGAVCYGEDVWKAFFRMETVEHFARVNLVAELLGGPNVLPREEVHKLLDSRSRYGIKSRTGIEPGCPVVAEDTPAAAPHGEERYYLTRTELIALVDEAMRAGK
jgi:L-fuculose-phosphate aldolase